MFSRGEGGEVGWGADPGVGPPGRPPGGVQFAAACTLPGGSRGTGLGTRVASCATGVSAGGCAIRCSPHAPRRFPRGWERQGWTRVRLRAARRVFGIPGSDFRCHFRPSKHYFRPTLALRRARQASDPAKLIEVGSQDFFSGSAAVAAGHLVSADPGEACGAV